MAKRSKIRAKSAVIEAKSNVEQLPTSHIEQSATPQLANETNSSVGAENDGCTNRQIQSVAVKKRGFQPGISGNPKGRPKNEYSLTNLIRLQLQTKADVKVAGKYIRGKTKGEILAARIVDTAIGEVNPRLVDLIVHRIDGTINQAGERENAPNITLVKIYQVDASGRIVNYTQQPDIPIPSIDNEIGSSISIPTLPPPSRASGSEGQP